jgi:hypothetical protein
MGASYSIDICNEIVETRNCRVNADLSESQHQMGAETLTRRDFRHRPRPALSTRR